MAQQSLTRRTPRWRLTTAAVVLAAFALGALFVAVLPVLVLPTGLRDRFPASLRMELFGPAVVALTVVAPLALRRVSGWLVALVGLLVATVTHQLVELPLLAPQALAMGRFETPILVEVAGIGLALGGLALAIGQVTRSVRVPVAVGFAVGLVGQPLFAVMVRPLLPSSVNPVEMQLWLALVAVLTAVLLGLWRAPEPPGRPVHGPHWPAVAVVAVSALMVIVGMLLRWWTLPKVLGGRLTGTAGAVGEVLSRQSTVLVALAAGACLLGYAYRAFGVVGVRWTVLGLAASSATLITPLSFLRIQTWHLAMLAAVGVLGLVVGAALARYVAWVLPWDALGVAMAAVGLLVAVRQVQANLPAVAVVGAVAISFGVGLAFGHGLTFLALSTPATEHRPTSEHPLATEHRLATEPQSAVGQRLTVEDQGWHGPAFAFGLAAWIIVAQALSPLAIRFYARHVWLDSPIPLAVLTGFAALALAVFFVIGYQARRLGHVLSPGPGPGTGPGPGPVVPGTPGQ